MSEGLSGLFQEFAKGADKLISINTQDEVGDVGKTLRGFIELQTLPKILEIMESDELAIPRQEAKKRILAKSFLEEQENLATEAIINAFYKKRASELKLESLSDGELSVDDHRRVVLALETLESMYDIYASE